MTQNALPLPAITMTISSVLCAIALSACGGGEAHDTSVAAATRSEQAAAQSRISGTSAGPAVLDLGAAAGGVSYAAPLRITRGGTYEGNWQSSSLKVAAVTIATTEPVVIQNCRLKGRGVLLQAPSPGANVTLRNCEGLGLNPDVAGAAHGRFFSAYKPARVVVEHNSMQDTAGVYVDANGGQSSEITIRFNRARNIEGRLSNGNGGYSTNFTRVQFAQLNSVRDSRNVAIAWNEVINDPRQSRVEDNINIYLSSGTADSPITIRNNYIQGGYPADPVRESYSGGGIIVDGDGTTMGNASGYVDIVDNQVVATTNYGIAISAGHHVKVQRNRVVFAGRMPDGQRIDAANVGIYVWDMNGNARKGTFHHHQVTDNMAGWINKSGERNDYWMPDCGGTVVCARNHSVAGSISAQTEDAEYAAWTAAVRKKGYRIGASL